MRFEPHIRFAKLCIDNCVRALERNALVLGVGAGVVIGLLGWSYYSMYLPPTGFPIRTLYSVPEGATLASTAHDLSEKGVVRSALALQLVVTLKGGETTLKAGDYYFRRPLTVSEVAARLVDGEFGLTPVRVTVPEGATSYQIADILSESLPKFDKVAFLERSAEKEGYLFPDTYLFAPNATIDQLLSAMEDNFYARIEPYATQLQAFGKPLREVVTMASLLEKEARTLESRRMIAGILWQRLAIDMPLQVDAVFGFIERTNTFHPTFDDLEVESPYNTYQNMGLPPGPIANPGTSSIQAAITPEASDYLFYLTGNDGNMYYGETYDQHLLNKHRYLN